MKHLNTLAASAGLFASLAIAAPAVAQTELIYNSYLPPFNETFQIGIRDFAASIEEESGGDLIVTIPDSTLAPSNRQYEMVRDGIADIAVVATDAIDQFVKLNELGGLPGMAPTAEVGSVALWETYEEYFKPQDELPGVIILSTHTLPGRDILTVGDLTVGSPADLEGTRIWATARPFVEASEALGAVPIDTEFTELQEFTARGDIDAIFITAGSAGSAGVLDMTTQIARLPGGFGTQTFQIIMSEQRFNELTGDQQAAIMRAAEGLPRRLGAGADGAEQEVADTVEEIGVDVFEGEALAAFQDVVKPQIDGWKERAAEAGLEDPQAAIDFFLGVVERETAD